jgi:glycosyltransferase involved in cell wall biosynthesis
MRICRVATVPFFLLHHLKSQICATVKAGHEVFLVTSPGPGINEVAQIPGISLKPIKIERGISLLADFRTLIALYLFFSKSHVDVVHSTTPKAGFLCALAGLLARVPIRLHTFTGQRWMELGGTLRWILKACDWLIVNLNTRCYADSESQRDFLIEQGIASPEKIKVLGAGSLAGVDLAKIERWHLLEHSLKLKTNLRIPENAKVITFVGRVTRDKGIAELVAAFDMVYKKNKNALLILVGPFEPERDPLPENLLAAIYSNPHIRVVGYDPEPEKYLAISDVLCLPSYREGFGNVVIEAAALGVPTVGTDIIGLKDSIVNQETGILVPPKHVVALATALSDLLADDGRRKQMGEAAKRRAVNLFDSVSVNSYVLHEYDVLFRKKTSTG